MICRDVELGRYSSCKNCNQCRYYKECKIRIQLDKAERLLEIFENENEEIRNYFKEE